MRYERKDLIIEGGRKLYLYSFLDFEANARKQARLWGVVGENWKNDAERVEEWFAPVTSEMLRLLPESGGVLVDVGCGAMTMEFPGTWRTLGIDVAAEMWPNVVGDESRLPVRTNCVDAVTGRFSYMFSVSVDESFAEAYRVLKPGGAFVFASWAGPEKNNWAAAPMDYLCDRLGLDKPEPKEPHAFRLANREEVNSLLTATGFSEVTVTGVKTPYPQTLSPEGAVDFVLGLAGPLRLAFERIPVKDQASVRADLVKLAEQHDRTGYADVWSAKKVVDKVEKV